MGYSSMDDLLSKITVDGKYFRYDWNKATGATVLAAGRWYNLGSHAGSPQPNTFAGNALEWTTCDDSNGIGIPHGGNVSPDTKHILNVFALGNNATGTGAINPGQLMLVDLQGYWPGISTNSTSQQNLSGTPTFRYTNGSGCRMFFVQTVAAGARAFNLSSLSYTNQDSQSGKTMPVSVALAPSAIIGHISHSGTAGANYGPFLPLADGDTGVQNVESITFSTASGAGTGALCIGRPLLTLPLISQGVASERDLLNQLPSLPRVYDGACLTWLFFAGAATAAASNIYGYMDFGWG
jgi:hypothetical protein